MGFNTKSSNCHKILIVIHWIFRKLSYLCPRIKAFFVYCKIQKRAEVRSFPYCYLYNIGKPCETRRITPTGLFPGTPGVLETSDG